MGLTVGCLAWVPELQLLASGSADKMIRLWDLTTGSCNKVLEGHTGTVRCLVWMPEPQLLASWGDLSHTIRLWGPTTGSCNSVLEGHTNHVTSLEWIPELQLARLRVC